FLREALALLASLLDRADVVEGLLREVVVLALEHLPEAPDRVRDLHILAGDAGELLSDEHRLREESLQLPRSRHEQLVLIGELVDPEDRDDVLKVLVALQHPLDLARRLVVLLADDVRVERAARRRERVDGRVETELGQVALEPDRRVEVRERRGRRRIGVIVGWHEDRLQRGDRALLRRGDAFLQLAHLGGERRLVADGAGHAAEKCRYLRTRLGEPEDVVDEDEEVATLLVAEVLRDGEAGERDPQARTGRLVHLAEDHRHLVDDAGFFHLAEQLRAFARALAHTAENRVATVLRRDVPDDLLNDDGLSAAGTAEHRGLSALQEPADAAE